MKSGTIVNLHLSEVPCLQAVDIMYMYPILASVVRCLKLEQR